MQRARLVLKPAGKLHLLPVVLKARLGRLCQKAGLYPTISAIAGTTSADLLDKLVANALQACPVEADLYSDHS